jgi:hypothetical protein
LTELYDLSVLWSATTVPTGPKGQKRPADVIGNAVRVMRIAGTARNLRKRLSGQNRIFQITNIP